MTSKISINFFCQVNPSEDIEKIKTTIFNLFPDVKTKIENNQLSGNFEGIEPLTRVLQSIQHRNIKKTFFRILQSNISDNTTWFYLNKQAAFVNVVALCDNANESALGPIKVILESNDIEKTIQSIISD
jgi:hypothetical protein